MANGQAGDATKLSELRAKIDAIDESIHHLLMQRATVIDELIAAKGTQTVSYTHLTLPTTPYV